MKTKCIAAVRAAAKEIGREGITDAEIAQIDARLRRTMRTLARTEEGWHGMSYDQRISLAAERALADVRAEAQRKVTNTQLQIVKTAATEERIRAALSQFDGEKRAQALVRDIDHTSQYAGAIRSESMGRLMDLIDVVGAKDGAGATRRSIMFLFDAENPHMTADLATEVFRNADGSTRNKLARDGAKAWLKTIEDLRQRFNSGGGDVGRLEYGYVPQPHDSARVRTAGRDAWVQKIMPLVDRARYVDEAGARLPDAEVQKILGATWETIATDGMNKQEPGSFKGTGARANRGSDHRELHFKDGGAYLSYLHDFGRGTMLDAMAGHIGGISRDIALVERYGPNPNAQMRLQFDLAARADGATTDTLARTFGMRPQSYWNEVSGVAGSPQSAKLAQIGQDVRNVMTMGKLGQATISSITDVGTFITNTGYNKLSYWDAIKNYAKVASSGDARDFLTTHGIIAESMMGDLTRWIGETLRHNWSGILAQSTMKLSLMNAWTDTLRRAFSLTMMQGLARLSKTEWGKLTEWDRTHMERAGITEADWGVITRAELTHFSGKDHLTPEAIRATGDARANEVVAKVLGLITNESETAVINPDLATKTLAHGGGMQSGTVHGELARSVMQFKSFPIAMISRHWKRMMEAPKVSDGSAPMMANRLMYGGALLLTTTALGAIALQAKQVLSGKDPIDMTGTHAAKFWTRAVAQGGGLSIVGDMMLNDPGNSTSDAARSFAGTMAGPGISTAAQGLAIAVENAHKAANGKPTHAGAETVSLLRQNAPYLNLWYAKAAVDHAGMHALQENLSPGYLGKMQQRAAKEWGQSNWWQPGTGLPHRAPDFGKAVGQ
jgi:hypothetical protein